MSDAQTHSQSDYPYIDRLRAEGTASIGWCMVLTLLTCGIYGLFWEARQMRTLKKWLGRREFSFWAWFFLGIVTCGLYYLYSEYKMAIAIQEIQEKLGIRVNSSLATVSIIVSLIASPMVSSAIQQYEINQLK